MPFVVFIGGLLVYAMVMFVSLIVVGNKVMNAITGANNSAKKGGGKDESLDGPVRKV